MLMKKHRVGLLAAGVFAVATSASATTLLQMTFEEIVADSALVVVGEVIDSRVVDSATDGLVTITSFRVSDTLVGSPESTVEVATPGGIFRSGKFLLRESSAGVPVFVQGSEHMLFLDAGPQDAMAIVGSTQGAAAVFEGKEGRSIILPGGKGVEKLNDAAERVRRQGAGSGTGGVDNSLSGPVGGLSGAATKAGVVRDEAVGKRGAVRRDAIE